MVPIKSLAGPPLAGIRMDLQRLKNWIITRWRRYNDFFTTFVA